MRWMNPRFHNIGAVLACHWRLLHLRPLRFGPRRFRHVLVIVAAVAVLRWPVWLGWLIDHLES
jgi:hypothetical protein